MDRIDAMKVFVVALDEGSLAGAGRELGCPPAAVSRAIAFLEARVGAEPLHRTTRSIKLCFVARMSESDMRGRLPSPGCRFSLCRAAIHLQ